MIIMKKILTLVCFMAVVGVTAASAQTVWGGRVGLCYPTATTSKGEKIEGKSGLEIGPVLYYALKENVYVNSGAMLSIKNFADGDDNLKLYCLEVPLYVGYAFPLGGLDFYAQAGPYLGFKVGESINTPDDYEDKDGSGYDSGIGTFNAGLGLVGGININRFKIELGYQHGLTNVYDGPSDESNNFEITLGSMFIGVSYIF
jgi:hypothetical protein